MRRRRLALGRGIAQETQPAELPGGCALGGDWPRAGFVGTHEAEGFVGLWRCYGSAGEPLVVPAGGRAWAILGQKSGMTVFVDALMAHTPPKNAQTRRAGARHGHRWCHLFSDAPNLADLHWTAERIGLKREWFQNEPGKLPHYDLTPPRRVAALTVGVVACGRETLVKCIRAARAGENR